MQPLSLVSPWRQVLLTLHVVTTVSVLGMDLVLLTLGMASLGGADPRMVYPAAHLVSAWLVAPLAVLALGTGILLGVLTPWGLLRYWWVTIKLIITAVLSGVVLFVLVPRLGALAIAMTGPEPPVLTLGERLPLIIAPAIASTLLVVNVALAIFKPKWRLRSRTAATAAHVQAGPGSTTRPSPSD